MSIYIYIYILCISLYNVIDINNKNMYIDKIKGDS